MRPALPFRPLCLVLLTLLAVPALGQVPAAGASASPAGSLTVAPTRVVFEGRERSAAVTLVNTGARTATYRISFVEMRMTERGELEEVKPGTAGNTPAAEPMVRFSPRQVVLQPGVAQAVRLMLRKPDGLAAGEYRSHLLFRIVPEAPPAADPAAPADKNFSVQLNAVYGVSIPVIVRHGALAAATPRVDGLRLERAGPGGGPDVASFALQRGGDVSAYGDLTVSFAPEGGAFAPVATFKGVGVYTPNAVRRMRLALPRDRVLGRGQLRVTYAAPGGGSVLAQAEAPATP